MISNRQFFFNQVDKKFKTQDQMPNGHVWSQFFDASFATPVAIVATLIVTAFILQKFFGGIWAWLTLKKEDPPKDEGLPNFYKTVKLKDADWLISMNDYYETTYAMSTVSKELTSRLDANGLVTKPCQGSPWYNILANNEYTQDFAYVPTNNPKRAELIVDDDLDEGNDCEQSDMVALILNLAFVKQDVSRKLRFGAGLSSALQKKSGGKASRPASKGGKYDQLIDTTADN